MLPTIATRSAQPTSRAVSLTADPTPARLRGSEPMIDSAAGADERPRPDPSSSMATPSRVYPLETVIVDAISRPDVKTTSPPTTTRLVPRRFTSVDEAGATTIIAAANGSVRTPAWNGEYPSTNCRYCVDRKTNPNSAKNASVIVALAALNRRLRKK